MALKSSPNKFKSPNKNEEDDPNEQTNQGESSQNSQVQKRRPRSVKKRNSKRNVSHSPPNGYSRSSSTRRIVRSLPLVPVVSPPVLQAMNPYYGGQSPRYPVIHDWNIAPRMRYQNPLYNLPFQHVPVQVINPRMLPPPYQYPGGYAYAPPPVPQILRPPVIVEELAAVPYYQQNVYSPEQTVPNEICEPYQFENFDDPQFYEVTNGLSYPMDNMDFFSLPRELFPNAMMLSLDPNPVIDVFSRYSVVEHASWIMDLEFGVPREATSRPIAIYDVKYNSIHCKNTPNAIHPGFESCSPEFKSVMMFYYDCVFSTWYRGYVVLNQDRSVENFQSWLCPLMQNLGMCWP